MAHCENCSGDCAHCSGCGASYVLTEKEVALLRLLGMYAYLPVARRADDLMPICCAAEAGEDAGTVLQCLEKKNLIEIDFTAELKGFDGYGRYPLRGSCALTLQGQQVLDTLDIQGAC